MLTKKQFTLGNPTKHQITRKKDELENQSKSTKVIYLPYFSSTFGRISVVCANPNDRQTLLREIRAQTSIPSSPPSTSSSLENTIGKEEQGRKFYIRTDERTDKQGVGQIYNVQYYVNISCFLYSVGNFKFAHWKNSFKLKTCMELCLTIYINYFRLPPTPTYSN